MPKVTYDSKRGLVQETGTGVVFNADSINFSSLPVSTTQAITANSTITSPGVYTVTGNPALLVTLPDPSEVPGGTLVIRSLSANAHALTGSAAVAGVSIFRGPPLTGATVTGQKFTLDASIGETVTLISNGLAYCVAAGSGSITIP